MTSSPPTRVRLGLGLLALQVLTLPLELVVARAVTVPYDLVSGTISELGAVTCAEYRGPGGALAVCSPWHAVMNGGFVASGVLMIVGIVLARPVLRRGAVGTVAAGLWVLTGLASVATGLVPLDVSLDLHLLVSGPPFVTQPLAVLLTAVALPRAGRALVASGIGVGAVTLVAGAVFLAGGLPTMGGLLERVVLWPAALWLGAVTVTLLRRRPPAGAGSPGGGEGEGEAVRVVDGDGHAAQREGFGAS